MTYNTLDDGSLHGGSLHGGSLHGGSLHGGSVHSGDDLFAELNESEVDLKRAAFGQRTQKDISMDLNDLLAEMEDDRDERNSNQCSSSASSDSASLALDIGDAESLASPERIGSKLALDDLPSESKGLDWGSLNWGSFMGSFRKRVNMGSSRRLLRRKSSKNFNRDPETPSKRRKSVRFFKFDTILPSQESFRRRHSQTSRAETI
eukprot:CAMPEP_0116132848 /NCGR_PEP_ID=MMETSP0329-20121206/9778_1 /TAXON_ID=697910 /ORGANISM="Pseudo-nitzschia arenysensis, Strain B593" /LENGTH=204 /DNA_ID=CAMNT_0003627413 /DNA_START=216 /DNA_END=830 /DNA_ORIENTATION=+